MAFPVIETADTKNGTVTSNSASWTLTYPTNLASGDLILVFAAMDGLTSPVGGGTFATTFFQTGSTGSAVSIVIGKKLSDGTETGTFTLDLTASEQGGWRVFRITGWEGTIGTSMVDATGNAGACGAVVSAQSTTANPNPPNLDPNQWATEDTLWFACCGADTSRTISVYPLADNQTADVSGGSTGATLGLCSLNDAVSSKDPGTFTISASDDWVAATVAVRPAAAPPPPTLVLQHGFVNFNDPGVL